MKRVHQALTSEITMLIALGLGVTTLQMVVFFKLWQQVLIQNTMVTLLGTAFTISGMALLGLYGSKLLTSKIEQNIRLSLSLIGAFLLTLIMTVHTNASFITATALGAFFSCATLALWLTRKKLRQTPIAENMIKRVLILGAGQKALQMMEETANVNGNTEILGYIHQPGERERLPTQKVIYLRESLSSYAAKVKANEIVVAVDDRRNHFPMQQLLACKLAGIDVVDSVYFCERELRKMKLNAMELGWLIFSNGFGPTRHQRLGKRFFDLSLATLCLLITLPIWCFVLLTMVARRGFTKPIFAREHKIGFEAKSFEAFSFARAANNDLADKLIDQFKVRDWPLLINILKGQLSFVGPEAQIASMAPDLEKSIHFIQKRQVVSPGIFGWAQLQCDCEMNSENISTILEYDLYYLKNTSLLFDLVILFSCLAKRRAQKKAAAQEKSTVLMTSAVQS
jgi:lipopolysaccharide/colanic/teichoic acid biosynthesis glycosyltransferase